MVRQELGIRNDAKVVTLLGRTQLVKGHRLALEAMANLENAPWHFLMLVKDLGEFPRELQHLKDFIETAGIQDRVSILGFQKNLARILSVTDLGVIPSLDSEVNCRVAVEFLSMGKPILAFPTGTLPDVIQHGVNGYLTKEKSVGELTIGIQQLLSDEIHFQQLRKNAQLDFQTRYTLEKMTSDTCMFYDKCSCLQGQ